MFTKSKSAGSGDLKRKDGVLSGNVTIVDGGRVSSEKADIIEINGNRAVISTRSKLSEKQTLLLTVIHADNELTKELCAVDSEVANPVDIEVQVTVIRSQQVEGDSERWLSHLRLSRQYRLIT